MKARDYAERFRGNPTLETLNQIVADFVIECQAIGETRKVQTDSGMYAILNEQDKKWQAFSRLIDGVKPDGFREFIHAQIPEVYNDWQNYQKRCSRV